MSKLNLRAGSILLAVQIQEASDAKGPAHSNVRARLHDAINDAHRGTGSYASYVDHTGDGKSGSVIYSVDGGMKSAPYTLADTAGSASGTVDTANAKDVIPHTTYKAKAAAATEASTATEEAGSMVLVESAATLDTIVLKEARADYPIKLIAPGKGSSAFYPAEVLKRDGPEVFKAGTHVYLNHPTNAEESARPEGDVKNLAGVLTSNAYYDESHAKGPGLYARMKVFADHGQMVEDKAPHVGMSIRASGIAESGKQREGVPVLAKLTSAASVDVVTRAGAGGMILTEAAAAAKPIPIQEGTMDAQEISRLVEAGVRAATAPILARGQARDVMVAALAPIKWPNQMLRETVESRVMASTLPMKDGALDTVAFGALIESTVNEEATRYAAYTGGVKVVGLGTGAPAQPDPKALKEAAKEVKRELKESAVRWGFKTKEGRRIFNEGRDSYNPEFNTAEKREGVLVGAEEEE